MSKLSKTILEKIQKEHKKPTPRWMFLLKNIFIWGLLITSVFFVGMFLGGIILNLMSLNWEIAPRWPGAHFGFLHDALEGVWILGIVLALIGSVLFFRSTKRGYRYGVSVVVSVLLLLSFGLGAVFLFTPIPGFMHEWHGQNMPMTIHMNEFHYPEKGRLIGDLIEINGDTAYLQAPDQTEWELWLFGYYPVRENDFVLVFGEVIDTGVFAVTDMRPVPSNYFVQE